MVGLTHRSGAGIGPRLGKVVLTWVTLIISLASARKAGLTDDFFTTDKSDPALVTPKVLSGLSPPTEITVKFTDIIRLN